MRTLAGLLMCLMVGFSPAALADEEFHGRLTDHEGNPVAEATVWLTAYKSSDAGGPSVTAGTMTDADGRFAFAPVPSLPAERGGYNICAVKEGFGLAWTGGTRGSDPDIRLVLDPEFRLSGRITDAAGKPIPGIRPRVSFLARQPGFDPLALEPWSASFGAPESMSELLVTATDEGGQFELRHLPPGIRLSLSVQDDRYGRAAAYHHWTELASGRPIEVTLQPPATVRGRVYRQHDGKPMAGVEVACSGAPTATDEQGHYEFTNVPEGVHQIYLHEIPTAFTAKAVEVTVRPGGLVEGVDLVLVEGCEIKGRVTEKGTGAPVAGAQISCNTAQQPRVGHAWPLVETDEQGRYSLRAPEGPAEIRVLTLPDGWTRPSSAYTDFRRFTVSAQDAPFEENFEADRLADSLEIQVLKPDGQPAAYARLVISVEDSFFGPYGVWADEQGRFTYSASRPRQRFVMRAHVSEDMSLRSHLVEPDATGPVTLQLDADVRPTLTGRIVTENGQPVPYAIVRADANPPEGPEPPEGVGNIRFSQAERYPDLWRELMVFTLSDEQGRFTLRAAFPGMSQKLRIRAAKCAEREMLVAALAPAEKRDVGDIELAVADMVITGRVVDDNGQPLPNITVDVERSRGMFSRGIMAITDLDGRFRLEDLPREELVLAADRFRCNSRPVRVGPQDGEVTITAIPKESQILFTHELQPRLRADGPPAEVTLWRMYRYKGLTRDEEARDFLGLDIDVGQDQETGKHLFVRLLDDRGRQLYQAQSRARVGEKSIEGYELPEADAKSLTVCLSPGSPYLHTRTERFEPLEEQIPVKTADGRAAVLGGLELTDTWVEPATSVAPGEPPYLVARVYALVNADMRCTPRGGSDMGGSVELAPATTFLYWPDEDRLELPGALSEREDALREEAAGALQTLRDWGTIVPAEPVVVGCWLQSTGGHGGTPLPDAITVVLDSHPPMTVVFRDVPLPKELTQAAQP